MGRFTVPRIALLCGALVLLAILSAVFYHALPAARATTAPKAQATSAPDAAFRAIDDAATTAKGDHFVYVGNWQHIKHVRDGRSNGTSSRTYHIGDTAYFKFTGARFKIFGIKGPNGGNAELSIDNEPRALLRFYAPKKETGAEVYVSPPLPATMHEVDIAVVEALSGPAKRRYVNIDGAAYSTR